MGAGVAAGHLGGSGGLESLFSSAQVTSSAVAPGLRVPGKPGGQQTGGAHFPHGGGKQMSLVDSPVCIGDKQRMCLKYLLLLGSTALVLYCTVRLLLYGRLGVPVWVWLSSGEVCRANSHN